MGNGLESKILKYCSTHGKDMGEQNEQRENRDTAHCCAHDGLQHEQLQEIKTATENR